MKKLPLSEVLRLDRVNETGRASKCATSPARRHPYDCRPISKEEVNEARFWAKIDRRGDAECWPWMGAKNLRGYGSIGINKVNYLAHRIAVLVAGRELPRGMVIDHLCRNTSCCNPAHLDVVTQKVNAERRPEAMSRFCIRGHEFTPENTARNSTTGARICRECRCLYARQHRTRQRAEREEAAR